jgi:enoyl-CoA hydratase/carnithine racemase
MSDYATIAYSDEAAPVARVTLDQPERRNPISPLTCGELRHAFSRAADDEAIRVIVLTGAGKVFSAGGDLAAFRGAGAPSSIAEPCSMVDLLCSMHELGTPIVAMVNGHALAGGLGLMVACDLVIASDRATFGTTEINVGLWPMMITAEIARNIGRKKTLELMMTGERIDAAEAERIGLINRAVPAAELEDAAMALATRLASRSPSAMRMGLRAFYATQDMPLRPALEALEKQLAAVLATEDAHEGLTAFFEKRAPVWKGR